MDIDMTRKEEFQKIYLRQAEMVYRICLLYLKNRTDTEDAMQSIFLKAWEHQKKFLDENHEKAWFITVARNYCKDELKSSWKKKRVEWKEMEQQNAGLTRDEINRQNVGSVWIEREGDNPVLTGIMKLDIKYRELLYLYYFEEYAIKEISGILKRKESTIQSQLASARKKLRKILEQEVNYE